jgi:hypothetical protein
MTTTASGERICTNCQTKATISQIYCAKCGYILPDAILDFTNRTGNLTEPAGTAEIHIGTGFFHLEARLYLQAVGGKIIPVHINSGPVIIGRRFDSDDSPRYVDLSELGAQVFGVSRRHTQLELRDNKIYAVDLNSTNGTFINREWLVPGTPHEVRNRSSLQMGVLILRVLFT